MFIFDCFRKLNYEKLQRGSETSGFEVKIDKVITIFS